MPAKAPAQRVEVLKKKAETGRFTAPLTTTGALVNLAAKGSALILVEHHPEDKWASATIKAYDELGEVALVIAVGKDELSDLIRALMLASARANNPG